MLSIIVALLAAARSLFRSRTDIALEILALRHQSSILKRKRPRPPLGPLDRLFWTALRESWCGWRDVLLIVKPETVVAGIAPVSACTGDGDPGRAVAGLESPRKFEASSGDWHTKTPTGVHRRSTANSRSSVC